MAPATLDTWAGPVRVEWDSTAPLTPYGQLPFFIEYLKVAGLFGALVADCPLTYSSPNAPEKRDVLGTTMLSVSRDTSAMPTSRRCGMTACYPSFWA